MSKAETLPQGVTFACRQTPQTEADSTEGGQDKASTVCRKNASRYTKERQFPREATEASAEEAGQLAGSGGRGAHTISSCGK